MIHPELLEILCCPETKQPVRLASGAVLDRLNRLQQDGELASEGGAPVKAPIQAGLVREDGRFLYPVQDDIPIMLIEERIPIPEESGAASGSEDQIEQDRDPQHHEVDADSGT